MDTHGPKARPQIVEYFNRMNAKSRKTETADPRKEQSRKHLAPIVKNLSDQHQLSRVCRNAGCSSQSARRWADEGIGQLTTPLESFLKQVGIHPPSIFEAKLKTIEKEPANPVTVLARRIAVKARKAAESGKATPKELSAISTMLDTLLSR